MQGEKYLPNFVKYHTLFNAVKDKIIWDKIIKAFFVAVPVSLQNLRVGYE